MSQYAGMKNADGEVASVCDLRSDTFTRPNAAMRAAIAAAAVGDDVYGEDPTVNRLEADMAARLGKEAGVFFSSGTQSNLAAIMAHCGRGDEVIVGDTYHVYADEAAGASVLAGVALCPIAVEENGEVTAASICAAIKDDDFHYATSRLLCLENTVNGMAIPLSKMQVAARAARDHGLSVHLDGARFFNAILGLGCSEIDLASVADTVSICLSKGLGAPVGAVLVGDTITMQKARRIRKLLGGGTRQAGILAAAGLHALDHNLTGLADDHRRALELAKALRDINAGTVQCNTNMVFLTPDAQKVGGLSEHMARAGVKIGTQSPTIRMVLHHDIDDTGLGTAIAAFDSFFSETRG